MASILNLKHAYSLLVLHSLGFGRTHLGLPARYYERLITHVSKLPIPYYYSAAIAALIMPII